VVYCRARVRRVLTVVSIALTLCLTAHGSPKYKVLHSFNGSDGSAPWAGVILDSRRNVYGTTVAGGGGAGCGEEGCGAVFELTPNSKGGWVESILYNFPLGNGDGFDVHGSLLLDASGNLYGTTVNGGQTGCGRTCGTVYELMPTASGWQQTTLLEFNLSDGAEPYAGVVMDSAGNLYGTAPGGGPNTGGVAYELSPGSGGWNETVLNGFHISYYGKPAPGGSAPYAGLILGASGNLYGTTYEGGAACASGCGVVYELTPASGGGWNETVLHTFGNNVTDGVTPGWGALFMDSSGALYGTTQGGGSYGGVVFKLTPKANGRWKETILHDFDPSAYGPNAGVVMDKSGNLYGSTGNGGFQDCGVIYKLAPKPKDKWKYTVLHIFNGTDGCIPEGNLVLDKKGNLYGGTVGGGAYSNGAVFKLTP